MSVRQAAPASCFDREGHDAYTPTLESGLRYGVPVRAKALAVEETVASTELERRHHPEVRARLSGPGVRTFLAIAAEWGLTVEEQRLLLGSISNSTYHNWKGGRIGTLSYDQLERISLVLGVHKALRLLFADDATGPRWLRAVNTDLPFAGRSPLARMLRGSIDDLYAVRRYLDVWRGVWP
jgi:hypothetical protein